MRSVLSEPALVQTKVLRALVRCRRVGRSRPPKRHLAHLRYNFLYWSRSLGRCMRVFFYATTPQLPMRSSSGTHALAQLKAVTAPALADDRFISSILAGRTKSFFKTSLKRVGAWLAGEIVASAR